MISDDLKVSRKRALRAWLRGARVYLAFSISRKSYRCPVCQQEVGIGTEHVILREMKRSSSPYPVHHHIHRDCVPYESLEKAEKIPPREASRSRVNKRLRR